MDDFGRQFPYPRYLKVPFIFLADGEPEPPEWAQFKRDYPGWVMFRATFVPEPPPVLEAEPAQHHVPNTEPMTEAEAEAAYWAHRDARSVHHGDVDAALAAAKATSSSDFHNKIDTSWRSPVPPPRPKANRSLPPAQLWATAATPTSHPAPLLRLAQAFDPVEPEEEHSSRRTGRRDES